MKKKSLLLVLLLISLALSAIDMQKIIYKPIKQPSEIKIGSDTNQSKINHQIIKNRLKKFSGKDKVLHFSYSALLTYYCYNFSRDILDNSKSTSINLSICLTSSLGMGKEFSDKWRKTSGFSWYDLTYDFAGVGLGLVMINNMR